MHTLTLTLALTQSCNHYQAVENGEIPLNSCISSEVSLLGTGLQQLRLLIDEAISYLAMTYRQCAAGATIRPTLICENGQDEI